MAFICLKLCFLCWMILSLFSVRHIGKENKDIVHVEFENGFQATLHLFMDISSTFQISVYGQNGWRLIDIRNSYSMFRDNIIEFIRSVQENKARLTFDKTENIIRTLIGATESLKTRWKNSDPLEKKSK